ncbi:MAG: alpha-ketoglutarate-dependent dioxygenase AlkB [Candidatus Kariarchaeaceae archaeon]|jgi:alkylated DNA repair dioxygenase AlkB
MSLEYFFLDSEDLKPNLRVSQPVPESYLIRYAFTIDEIKEYYHKLTILPWLVQQIEVAGKYYMPKRETLGFADEESSNLINDRSFYGLTYPEFLFHLRSEVQFIIMDNISEIEQTPQMNYTWGNRYRDGNDKVGKHKDNEKWHSKIDPIVSVSFGEYRHFDIYDNYKRISRVDLGFGDIFLMMPGFQQLYYHGVPTQKTVTNSRINLTFRTIDRDSKNFIL